MTAAGPSAGPDLARRIRASVVALPDVAGLSGGALDEIVPLVPGTDLPGVRVDDDRVEVRIVTRFGAPLRDVARDLDTAVRPLLGGRGLSIVVDDIVLPGESLDDVRLAPDPESEPDEPQGGPADG